MVRALPVGGRRSYSSIAGGPNEVRLKPQTLLKALSQVRMCGCCWERGVIKLVGKSAMKSYSQLDTVGVRGIRSPGMSVRRFTRHQD